jgi:hypothetical protein
MGTSITDLTLEARESQRVDIALKVGATTENVTVEATEAGVVNSEESSISTTVTGHELLDLPVGLATRISASTSAFASVATEPGVEAASTTSMVIAGATPAMQSVTVDGIGDEGVEQSTVLTENLPSFNGISEMRVSQSNNNAEYSGMVDITTTTKSGTDRYHGGFTENYNSKGFNSDSTFNQPGQKPNVVMNNFGLFAGGPVRMPGLGAGNGKTFFFIDYEGLRFPQSSTVTETVPTAAMQSGNLCAYLDLADNILPGHEPALFTPNGTQISCSSVPIESTAAAVMKHLYPQPNVAGNPITNNYAQLFPDPTSVNQGDLRIDRIISTNHTVYGRLSYKYIQSTNLPANPAIGSTFSKTADAGLVVADNYTITPHLLNELRGGVNGFDTETIFNSNNSTLLASLNITDVQSPPFSALPSFAPGGIESATSTSNASSSKSRIMQVFDNLTWIKNGHSFKFGADVRRVADFVGASGAFGSTSMGQFTFGGNSVYQKTCNAPTASCPLPPSGSAQNPSGQTGDAFAQFLLGFPDSALLAQSTDPGMSAWAFSEALYGQDSWNVTNSLTLTYGLRWELHPALQLHSANATGFDANYTSTINGVVVHGAVVAPNAAGLKIVNPAFAASIAPTPILTALQDGIPSGLRFTDRLDFGPRVGFAWRLRHNGKSVIRGGWGRFVEPPMGGSAYFNWGVATTDNLTTPTPVWTGSETNGSPAISFPNPFTSATVGVSAIGSQNFEDAFDPHYRDPWATQYNLTFEQDLGQGIGLRLGYIGNKGSHLDYPRDLNQIAPNTTGYAANEAGRPFPLWNYIDQIFNGAESNYNSLSAVATKRLSRGLQFQSSYTFTRDLSDAAGGAPSRLAGVGGAGNAGTWGANPRYDYGNVTYDRRHRLLNTFLYELPFGSGKKFLTTGSPVLAEIVGGWQVAGIVVDESGSFIQVTDSKIDPSGTGQGGREGNYVTSRVDVVPGISPHAPTNTYLPQSVAHSPRGASEHEFLNVAAFSIPANNIGRFANEPVGFMTGPGQQNVSLSMKKVFAFPEQIHLELGCAAANVLNHKNFGNPSVSSSSATSFPASLGAINSLLSNTSGEAGGPRILQITGRLTF